MEGQHLRAKRRRTGTGMAGSSGDGAHGGYSSCDTEWTDTEPSICSEEENNYLLTSASLISTCLRWAAGVQGIVFVPLPIQQTQQAHQPADSVGAGGVL